MQAKWFVLALCAAVAGCKSQTPLPGPEATQAVEGAAQSLDDMAAQNCPFPAEAAQYEVTTLAARGQYTPVPRVGVFDAVPQGCAVLVFTLGDGGTVSDADVLSENPAGFGAVAQKILRWNNYAFGTFPDTRFIVRVAGEKLPAGGAMTSLGFKDNTINFEVPP